ncbi:hypothetical protein [Streptomyces sp. NPDC051776]|uniref:hypothetical protein n=1 Tax=Streptomyces sp. NPDC051776 TaxID=3155414 RepID=UPI00341642EF
MHDIDERLAQWAAHASRPQLRAGPTVEDLGGLDAVLGAADHLAQGPFLHHLIQATAHHLDTCGTEACKPLYDAVLNGLRTNNNHAAFASATDTLAGRPALARELGTPLTRVLLARLQQAQDADDDPAPASSGWKPPTVSSNSPWPASPRPPVSSAPWTKQPRTQPPFPKQWPPACPVSSASSTPTTLVPASAKPSNAA